MNAEALHKMNSLSELKYEVPLSTLTDACLCDGRWSFSDEHDGGVRKALMNTIEDTPGSNLLSVATTARNVAERHHQIGANEN